MKHPIYAILLATIITLMFWQEQPPETIDDNLERNNALSPHIQQENVNLADSIHFQTNKIQRLNTVIVEKETQRPEETPKMEDQRIEVDSTKTNILLPSD